MKVSEYITIEEALKKGSGKVNLRGWIYRQRASNKFVFIVLRDESDIIQCVIPKSKNPQIFEVLEEEKKSYSINAAATTTEAHSFSFLLVAYSVICLVSTIFPPILKTSRFSS